MMNNRYTLVIVDMQNDFCNPNGSLYVQGSEVLVDKIVDFITNNKDNIYQVIFTLDWHDTYNTSFKDYGGTWPVHCLQYSEGAAIPNKLIDICRKLDIHTEFSKKGFNGDDEYGAFGTNITNLIWPSDNPNNKCYILNSSNRSIHNDIKTYSDYYVVCGLCGDYCVMETIKNLRKNTDFMVKAARNLIMSIDGGEKFNKYIEETHLEILL